MTLNEFNKEPFGLNEAQFALAIALDQMGKREAFLSVVSFLGTNVSAYQSLYQYKVKEERQRLENELKEQGALITSLINYLMNTQCLICKNSRTSAINVTKLQSLAQLVPSLNTDELYDRTMRILLSNTSDNLIAVCARTLTFGEHLGKILRNNVAISADGFRKNDFSASVINEIQNLFASFIATRSANGTYKIETGTPFAFLVGTWNQFFFIGENKMQALSFINKRGTSRDIDGEGTSLVDIKGIIESVTESNINFTTTCNKIYRASKLLFEHPVTGSTKKQVVYDIFSYHRDRKIKKEEKELHRELDGILLKFYDFHIIKEYEDIKDAGTTTQQTKMSGRRDLCEVFETFFENGIHKEDIIELYEGVMKATLRHEGRDGVRLFTANDHKVKQTMSNSEMFHVLVEGYVALYQLLAFIEGNKNTTGVNINNFPVDIFRDQRYLYRVSSFKEYVSYIRDIRQLVDEVDCSEIRSQEIINGFYDNDKIQMMLGQNNLLRANSVLYAIQDKSIGFLAEAYAKTRSDNFMKENSELVSSLCIKVLQDMDSYVYIGDSVYVTREQFEQLDTGQILYAISYYCTQIAQLSFHELKTARGLRLFIALKNALFVAFEKCGHSLSVNEFFNYPDSETFTYYITEGYSEEQRQSINDFVVWAIANFEAVIDPSTVSFEPQRYTVDFEQVRNFFASLDVAELYVEQLTKVCEILNDYQENNLYLTLARAVYYKELFTLAPETLGVNVFSKLDIVKCPQYFLRYDQNHEEKDRLSVSMKESMLAALRFTISVFEEQTVLFKYLDYKIDTVFNYSFDSAEVIDIELENKLRKAFNSFSSSFSSASELNVKRNRLSLIAKFDDMGYMVFNGKRIVLNNNAYVHKYGYKVTVSELLDDPEIEELTDVDIDRVVVICATSRGAYGY